MTRTRRSLLPPEVEAMLQANLTAADRISAAAGPSNESHGSAENAGGNGSEDRRSSDGPRPNYTDPTKNRRAVESHFSGTGERAKFTGDLAKAPSFSLWERRYRALVKNLNMEEKEKVLYLSEALADPALSFFYEKICPDDSRAGNDLPEAAMALPTNMAPNIATLSGALRILQNQFCTDSARTVLKQDLDQLTLSAIEADEKVSKPKALGLLKDKIKRLSANGPAEYSSEACMITALKNSLQGELWAVTPIINCEDRAAKDPSSKTLEHYTQTLVSFLRMTETLTQNKSANSAASPAVPTLTHGYTDVFYGDSRANPRKSRSVYRQSAPVRFSPMTMTHRAGSRSVPNGGATLDMRNLLNEPSRKNSGQTMDGQSVRQRGKCWNCDQPGHISRDCRRPRRPRAEIARAMLAEHVPPVEVTAWLSHEIDEMENVGENDSAHEQEADIEYAAEEEEDPVETFDTLLASLSGENATEQILQ